MHPAAENKKKKAASAPKRRAGMKGGALADGMDMRAIYNVSGIVTSASDPLATAAGNAQALTSVVGSSSANINSASLAMSSGTAALVVPKVGAQFGGAKKKPKDIKKSDKPKPKKAAAKKKK